MNAARDTARKELIGERNAFEASGAGELPLDSTALLAMGLTALADVAAGEAGAEVMRKPLESKDLASDDVPAGAV
jgi:hypothetical protein